MSTFLGFLTLVFIFFIGKFIYDTYLTNNTKERFDEFARQNPEEAFKISKGEEFTTNFRKESIENNNDLEYQKGRLIQQLQMEVLKRLDKAVQTAKETNPIADSPFGNEIILNAVCDASERYKNVLINKIDSLGLNNEEINSIIDGSLNLTIETYGLK